MRGFLLVPLVAASILGGCNPSAAVASNVSTHGYESLISAAIPIGSLAQPICGTVSTPDPGNPSLWQRWSNPATWPTNQVPAQGTNVVIPCGKYVVLDVPAGLNNAPSVVLNLLQIEGGLLLLDDPTVGNLSIAANFIFVFGALKAGTLTRHYRYV
jgi:hypothetical protein